MSKILTNCSYQPYIQTPIGSEAFDESLNIHQIHQYFPHQTFASYSIIYSVAIVSYMDLSLAIRLFDHVHVTTMHMLTWDKDIHYYTYSFSFLYRKLLWLLLVILHNIQLLTYRDDYASIICIIM